MNLDEIRNMNDEQLRTFMNNLSQRNNIFCSKCGNVVNPRKRKNINIGIYDRHIGQKVRKLCSLCNNCYVDLLDYLGISDIEWEEENV